MMRFTNLLCENCGDESKVIEHDGLVQCEACIKASKIRKRLNEPWEKESEAKQILSIIENE